MIPLDPGTKPARDGLPDKLAPWLIGFSVVLAFLAARILTWVRPPRSEPALASATHETLPKAFLHDLFGTTNWKRHRFEKPLTWLGRIVMETKGDDADHPGGREDTVGPRHAFIEYMQHDFPDYRLLQHNGTFVMDMADPCEGASQAR